MKEIKKEMKKMTWLWNEMDDENTLMNTDNYDSIVRNLGVGYVVLRDSYKDGFVGVKSNDREYFVCNAFKGGWDNPTFDGENPSGDIYTSIISPYALRLNIDLLFDNDFKSVPVLADDRNLNVSIIGVDTSRDEIVVKVQFWNRAYGTDDILY